MKLWLTSEPSEVRSSDGTVGVGARPVDVPPVDRHPGRPRPFRGRRGERDEGGIHIRTIEPRPPGIVSRCNPTSRGRRAAPPSRGLRFGSRGLRFGLRAERRVLLPVAVCTARAARDDDQRAKEDTLGHHAPSEHASAIRRRSASPKVGLPVARSHGVTRRFGARKLARDRPLRSRLVADVRRAATLQASPPGALLGKNHRRCLSSVRRSIALSPGVSSEGAVRRSERTQHLRIRR